MDLAGNVAGRHVGAEANRRRATEPGADRSWRVGAEGEHIIAEALTSLTTSTWADRLRRRASPWWVLHSIPVGTGSSDIDHLVGGPPGVFSINTKHHRPGRDQRRAGPSQPTPHRVRRQSPGRGPTRHPPAAHRPRPSRPARPRRTRRRAPVLAIVGARLLGRGLPGGVLVATDATLALLLREQPAQLAQAELELLHQHARKSTTWTR